MREAEGAAQLDEVTAGSCGAPQPASSKAAALMLNAARLVVGILMPLPPESFTDRRLGKFGAKLPKPAREVPFGRKLLRIGGLSHVLKVGIESRQWL